MSLAFIRRIVNDLTDDQKLNVPKIAALMSAYSNVSYCTPTSVSTQSRRDALRLFKRVLNFQSFDYADVIPPSIESMSKTELQTFATSHHIVFNKRTTVAELRDLIVLYAVSSQCLGNVDSSDWERSPSGCSRSIKSFLSSGQHIEITTFLIHSLSRCAADMASKPLKRVLRHLGVQFDESDSVRQLRRKLIVYTDRLSKAKHGEGSDMSWESVCADMVRTREEWPRIVSDSLKDKICSTFMEFTSTDSLRSGVCACCAESCFLRDLLKVKVTDIDLDLLRRPDLFDDSNLPLQDKWLDPDMPPFPFSDGVLSDALVDPRGVFGSGIETELSLCKSCRASVKKGNIPALALSNRMYVGDVPPELRDLTVVEESMIALCRTKCCIVRLKYDGEETSGNSAQRGLKGNLIIYPQRPSDIAKKLPPSIEEITSPLCVIFVGSHPPSAEWLREKAKPLAVRGNKVRQALIWLKKYNRLYKEIEIDESVLSHLEANPILPFHIEHVAPSRATENLTSRYDSQPDASCSADTDSEIPFTNVVITDVDNLASSAQLVAAAMRHIKRKGGAYIQIPHEPNPANEFFNPELFPKIYPTLFPYGIGGFEDRHRPVSVSMKRHVKHLFSLADRRVQEHYSFPFTAFNVLQRREMLLRVGLKAKKRNFEGIASRFARVSKEALHAVAERYAKGDSVTTNNDEEKLALELMKQVNAVTTHVQGSNAGKVVQRSELKALMIDQSLPSFYLTINPADVFNPLVRFLAGSEIDVDTVLPDQFDSWAQSKLVAKNPFVTANFFNLYMRAFIYAILGFDAKQRNMDGGILGKVKAYYGCVEAQARGTLHCHMLIWVEGGLNPDEIKHRAMANETEFTERLIAFLDDTISNSVPPDVELDIPDYDPCCVRHPPYSSDSTSTSSIRQSSPEGSFPACVA